MRLLPMRLLPLLLLLLLLFVPVTCLLVVTKVGDDDDSGDAKEIGCGVNSSSRHTTTPLSMSCVTTRQTGTVHIKNNKVMLIKRGKESEERGDVIVT